MLQRRGLKPQRRGFHPKGKERPSSGASRHLLPAQRGEGRHPGGAPRASPVARPGLREAASFRCGQRMSVTSVGNSHAPPAKPLHMPVEGADVFTKAVPFQVHCSEPQQSPMPRAFWVEFKVRLSKSVASAVTSSGRWGPVSLMIQRAGRSKRSATPPLRHQRHGARLTESIVYRPGKRKGWPSGPIFLQKKHARG